MKANIFNIQKSSILGSSGVQTIISFKGCALRCPWCAKPESETRPTELLWDRKKCFYGHLCEIHCPTGSLSFKNDVLFFNHETCNMCRDCISQCPTKALEFAGNLMELDEVMDEILKDKGIYEETGAGVTLTGGEPLDQPEFTAALLKACKEQSIHTSLETSGYATPLVFSRISRNVDRLVLDIKHYNNKEHVKYTGVSMGKILENLDSAVAMKIPVTCRIPVIPGINSSLKDAANFVKLLKEHRITSVTLLPFKQLGVKKYEELDVDYVPKDCMSLRPEELGAYLSVFRDAGLNVTM